MEVIVFKVHHRCERIICTANTTWVQMRNASCRSRIFPRLIKLQDDNDWFGPVPSWVIFIVNILHASVQYTVRLFIGRSITYILRKEQVEKKREQSCVSSFKPSTEWIVICIPALHASFHRCESSNINYHQYIFCPIDPFIKMFLSLIHHFHTHVRSHSQIKQPTKLNVPCLQTYRIFTTSKYPCH